MEISVYFSTYNAHGGHNTLTLIGDYLLLGDPMFGDAIAEIEVIMHFRSDDSPRKTLEAMYDSFHARLAELPKITFRRKKKEVEISFHSTLLTARELERSRELSLDLFRDGCREVVENLKLLRKRIRKDDSFDFPQFESLLDERVESLPLTLDELATIQSKIKSRREAASAALTDWEKTGIDFDEFHPDARVVLSDAQLWDVCDEWAPNGNDTGADILELYRGWWKRNGSTSAEIFFKQLMDEWEVAVPPDPHDEYSTHTYHQAIVGLAFAQLKLHAKCEPRIASIALKSLKERSEHDLTHRMTAILEQYVKDV